MARTSYAYTKVIVPDQVATLIHNSSIITALDTVVLDGTNNVTIWFKDSISDGDKTTLDSIISSYTVQPFVETVPQLVQTASPKDTDGSELSRLKLAPAGWTFQDHSFEFTTAKISSMYSKKSDGSDFNFATMRFYEGNPGSEVEITQGNLTQEYLVSNCTKTIIDWEPTHDYDVIAGEVRPITAIAEYVRVWVVAVPDFPSPVGSKELVTGGKNLKGLDVYELDGRVTKHMTYTQYHTNKIRMIFRHPIGYQATIEGCIDFYKA